VKINYSDKVQLFALVLLAFFLPLWRLGSSIGFALVVLHWFYEGDWRNKWPKLKHNYFFWGTSFLFLLYLLSAVVYHDKQSMFELEKRIGLFLIPTVLLSSSSIKERKSIILYVFLLGVLFLDLRALGGILYHYMTAASFNLSQGGQVNTIIHHERPYVGAFSALGLAFTLLFYREKKGNKYLPLIAGSIFIITVFIISAKLAMGMILVLLMIFLLLQLGRKSILYLLGVLAFGCSTYFWIPSVHNRFSDLIEKKNEPRLFIWPSAIKAIPSNPFNHIYGTFSEKNTEIALNKEYKKETQIALQTASRWEVIAYLKKNKLDSEFDFNVPYDIKDYSKGKWWWLYADKKNFNTHNQFLGIYLSYGLLGLLSIGFMIYGLSIQLARYRNYYLLFSIIVIFLFLLFENILAKQQGVFMFGLFLSLFYTQPSNKAYSSIHIHV